MYADTAVWVAAAFAPVVDVTPIPPAAQGLNTIRERFGVSTLTVTFSSDCLLYFLLPHSPDLCFVHMCLFLLIFGCKGCKSFGITRAVHTLQ